MNPPKVTDEDYINFIIATPRQVTATEAASCQPEGRNAPAHDAFTRLLSRLEPDAEQLWEEAKTQIDLKTGILVLDDSTLDKPYSSRNAVVYRHWSGKQKEVVEGINLISLLWTDGVRCVPIDYRVFDKDRDRKSKNDHFAEMLLAAFERGFNPQLVCFDSWYASVENLKLCRALGWHFLTRLKANRQIRFGSGKLQPVAEAGLGGGQQPEVNVVRTTIQALAAVLGGTQSLHTNSMDEALSLPTENAARIALRTQQVIAFESGVADTVDPFAGSYAIEELTTQLERKASEYIEKIDNLGGMLRAIESGYVQREIQEAAYDYQKALEEKTEIVVGVNQFHTEEDKTIPILRVDPQVERNQIERVTAVRAKRDKAKAENTLVKLEEAARGTENLLPRILECVESYVTVGEISHRLRKVWGEYREAVTV